VKSTNGKMPSDEIVELFSSLLKANYGNPLLLISPTAQKEIEHFLDDEASKDSAVKSSAVSATLDGGYGMEDAQELLKLFQDPKNLARVFTQLADVTDKVKELEVRIPQLEAETQTAKRRGFSAMGTAGALTVEADRLRQENERLQLQSSSLLTEIGKLSATHHDFIAQLKDTYGVEIGQLKFSNKAFIETLTHVSEQYPWLPKTIKEAKEQLRGDRKLDWGSRGNLYVRWAAAATGKQDITFERLQCECLSRNFITEGDLLRKLKEVADRRRVS
jgi:chromosome segregation ATPase